MAFSFSTPQTPTIAGRRSEQLARLAYELLDAHADTVDRFGDLDGCLLWRAHLDYLRDLQRAAKEVLADVG